MINFDEIKLCTIKIGHKFQTIHTENNNRRFMIWKNKCTLLNLIENQPDIDKIQLYAKDPYEAKYQ